MGAPMRTPSRQRPTCGCRDAPPLSPRATPRPSEPPRRGSPSPDRTAGRAVPATALQSQDAGFVRHGSGLSCLLVGGSVRSALQLIAHPHCLRSADEYGVHELRRIDELDVFDAWDQFSEETPDLELGEVSAEAVVRASRFAEAYESNNQSPLSIRVSPTS